jgi:hypothetical protein
MSQQQHILDPLLQRQVSKFSCVWDPQYAERRSDSETIVERIWYNLV